MRIDDSVMINIFVSRVKRIRRPPCHYIAAIAVIATERANRKRHFPNLIYSFLVNNLHMHTHLTALFRTTRVSQYQKGKTNLDFTEETDNEWQWHQLGHMQRPDLAPDK